MKKIIIGLKLKFLNWALVASVVALLGIFLPFVYTSSDKLSWFRVIGSSWIVVTAVIFTVITAALGIINRVRPSVKGVRIWVIAAALQAIILTVLLFAGKSILDGSGLLSEPFLVKSFGAGYWISIFAAYVALVMTMKTAKINTGYIVLTFMSVIWMFPILWVVLTSLRTESGYYVG